MSGESISQVAECCTDQANLVVQPDPRPGVTVRVCQVCGRRHFEVEAEPVRVGVRPT